METKALRKLTEGRHLDQANPEKFDIGANIK